MTAEQARAERDADRAALWQSLLTEGVAQGPQPPSETPQPVVDAAVRFVARTPSPLCLVPLEDLVGQEQQPNLPGTVDEHPNWRQRLPGLAASLLENHAGGRTRRRVGDGKAAPVTARPNAPSPCGLGS